MSNGCVFCGASGGATLSKEHVTPKWLLEHLELPEDDLLFQGVASSATDDLTRSPRIHSTFNFVQGHVCRTCNNGWMSRLESTAKGIVTPLIDQDRSLASLSTQELEILVKWGVKTAYLTSLTSLLNQPPPSEHIEALTGDGGRPASGVGVFAMQSGFVEQYSYYVTRHWPLFSRTESASRSEMSRDTASKSYKIGLQFRHLYLVAAFWTNPNSSFTLAKGIHTPLLCSKDRCLHYKFKARVGDGPFDRIALFCKTLGLVDP